MIHPSYSELIKVINQEAGEDDAASAVTSRYSVVLATSRRARQIISGDKPLINSRDNKPLSIAVEEFYEGKVKILPEEAAETDDLTQEEPVQEGSLPEENGELLEMEETAEETAEETFAEDEVPDGDETAAALDIGDLTEDDLDEPVRRERTVEEILNEVAKELLFDYDEDLSVYEDEEDE